MDLADQSRTVDSAPLPAPPRGVRFWLGTAAILALAALTLGLSAAAIVMRHAAATDAGWWCYLRHDACVVSSVDPEGAAAALLVPGDEVLAVNGRMSPWVGPARMLRMVPAGQAYTLVVRRAGRTLPLTLAMGTHGLGAFAWELDATVLISLLLFSLGLWIRMSGPTDLTARLASLTFLIAGLCMAKSALIWFGGWSFASAGLGISLALLPRPLQDAVGWDFLSRFPHPVHEGAAARVFRRGFYALAALLWLASNAPVFAELGGVPGFAGLSAIVAFSAAGRFGSTASSVFDLVTCVAVCIVLVRNYRLLVDRDSRRRIRWAAASFGLTAICIFLLRGLQLAAAWTGFAFYATAAGVADAMTTISAGLVPVVLTVAVVKHQVLGVQLVIRRGLQYLLAKNFLRLILLAPVLIVVGNVLAHPDRSLRDLILHSPWPLYPVVMITAALSLRYRHEMSRWLDRQFFRVALREEETWVALVESLQVAESEEAIAIAAAQKIDSAFVPDGLHIFFRSPADGEMEVGFSDSPDQVPALLATLDQSPATALASKSLFIAPLRISTGGSGQPVTRGGTPWLVVPLPGTNAASLGAFVLGPKKSDQPYTVRDRELLQAIASQVVMACEMLQLKRGISEHSKERAAVLGRLERNDIQLLNECPRCGSCFNASLSRCPIDGRELALTLPVERIIGGRYRLDRRLGSGGMGVVYQALDLRLNKSLAVKIMVGELFGNRSALMRFRQEAQAVGLLRHPNIIGVHDFGQLPAGGAFLAMDLVDGVSWREQLQFPGALRPERVASWIEQLCAGVAAAHGAGVIHRDLKPENVMITEAAGRENVIIMDFGVAKLHPGALPEQATLSVAGSVLGTRSYMSPEQSLGKFVDGRADVWAIAVMALETLARLAPPADGANRDWVEQALARIASPGSETRAILLPALADDPEVRTHEALPFGRALAKAIRTHVAGPIPTGGSDDVDTLSFGASG